MSNIYDGFGRLASSSIDMGGVTRTLGYQYDAAGNRVRIIHPDGIYFTTDYDALGRPSWLWANGGSGMAYHGYYAHGGVAGRSLANGTTSQWGYDGAQRLSAVLHGLAGTAHDATWTFGRNPAGQIASQARDNDAYAWTGHYAVARPYATNGLNQYDAAGSANFQYDANGNLIADGTREYAYDIENRLTERSGGTVLTYDPLGRLFQLSAYAAAPIQFLYDGDALVAEYVSGAMTRRYVHNVGADVPLLSYEGDTLSLPSYLHADHQGSIVAVSDPWGAGAVNTYDEYGIPGAANVGRFQYTGQIWLPEIGMYHYKARVYSPTLGRFLQTDPIGYDDQFNLYAYTRNDPVNLVDVGGGRTEVAGRNIRIIPWDTSRPRVTIPIGQTGARGIAESDAYFHHYDQPTSTTRWGRQVMGDAIAERPTPGPGNSPATPQGQVNNAGSIPLNGDTNLVQSFRVPSPDPSRYTDVTVNYTITGQHGLTEGFVMRYGEIAADGNMTMQTYGEGNAWEQRPLLSRFWEPRVDQTWRGVDRKILDSLRKRYGGR